MAFMAWRQCDRKRFVLTLRLIFKKDETMDKIFDLMNEMSPFILLGFLLAGLMHAFVPRGIYRKYLAGNSFRTVVNAALLGIPLPLCSCGVIPTAMSLRREGASKGSTVAFLISTPQTGVDSVAATYSLLGFPFALMRPIIAFVMGVVGGFVVNRFDKGAEEQTAMAESADATARSFGQKVREALRYAFVDMMQDIGKWLMMGLVVAGLITVFVPDSFFALFADKPFLSMLFVLLSSIPMYICATGSIPIAVALMMKGLSPGAALVLLMAGPAVNAASLLVIGKVMGRRTMLLYLSTIIVGTILFGLGIDYLLPREWFTAALPNAHDCCHEPAYFNIGCTLLMVVLLVNAFIRRHHHHHDCGCGCDHACDCGHHAEALTLHVVGMTCNHCKANVERAIRSVEGVENVEIDLASGRTVVQGHASRKDIAAAVGKIGFSIAEDCEKS